MESLASLLHLMPETFWMIVKVLIVFLGPLTLAALLTLGGAPGQRHDPGPHRPQPGAAVRPLAAAGAAQLVADGIKFFLKEDLVPADASPMLFWLAPVMAFVPAVLGFAVIPFGRSFIQAGHTYHLSLLDPGNGMGMLYPLAVAAVAVYGILTAAWSSNNKWAILGGMRSGAQMVSYEIAMGLAVVAVFMRVGGYDPQQIIAAQRGVWFVLPQILGFLVFSVCMFAETNRLPFDFAEGESEIVAGFHTEYGSIEVRPAATLGVPAPGHGGGADRHPVLRRLADPLAG